MSLIKKLKIAIVGICLASAVDLEARLFARDIYVPRDYTTIQEGIDVASDGDRVLVASGEYIIHEPITYRGKNIILKSEEGADETIIKMENPANGDRGSVFIFENGESNEAVLEGFTLTGGNGTFPTHIYDRNGGSIYCERSSPTILNNNIINNTSIEGGGISCLQASPLIQGNKILKNRALSEGGGIFCYDNSQPTILENIISENYVKGMSGGGIASFYNSLAIIKDNIIINNYANEIGGGICLRDSEALIEKNIIANNKTLESGGGIASTYSVIYVFRNTITSNLTDWGGSPEYSGGGIYFYHENEPRFHEGYMRLFNNIIWNNIGIREVADTGPSEIFYNNLSQPEFCGINGNICADPLFVNPNPDSKTLDDLLESGNYEGAKRYLTEAYSLQPDSPCIDVVDPDELIGVDINFDPDGSWADMGAIYFNHKKNRFKRGDSNMDGRVEISDPVTTLSHLYRGLELKCKDSADSNDDGNINIADAVYTLNYLFARGNMPPAPFSEAGYDFSHDNIGCYVPEL